MFYVGICDDELAVCEQVRDCLLGYANARKHELNIEIYRDGQEVLEYLKHGKKLHLLFLDIRMAMLDGVELGKQIREQLNDQVLQIVFISGIEWYSMELFQVRPMNFLAKPLQTESLTTQLELAMKLCREQQNTYFICQVEKEFEKISFGDILYFESQRRKLRVVTKQGETTCYHKLSEAEKTAPSLYFIRIHKSYLVNELHVRSWRADEVELLNGEKLPISRTYRANANEKLLEIQRVRGR